MIRSREDCIIGISPEGTRKRVDQFRTGFYYMALGAQVPIVLTKLDVANRVIGFSEPFYPSGDFEKDMAFITAYFRGVKGFVPEKGVFF
jgi:1-acyl-sn-glycerol-3-phosphate acyltransferase